MTSAADDIHTWLESFGLGYDRNDPSTIRDECLPIIIAKGLVQAYGAPHEVRSSAAGRLPRGSLESLDFVR